VAVDGRGPCKGPGRWRSWERPCLCLLVFPRPCLLLGGAFQSGAGCLMHAFFCLPFRRARTKFGMVDGRQQPDDCHHNLDFQLVKPAGAGNACFFICFIFLSAGCRERTRRIIMYAVSVVSQIACRRAHGLTPRPFLPLNGITTPAYGGTISKILPPAIFFKPRLASLELLIKLIRIGEIMPL